MARRRLILIASACVAVGGIAAGDEVWLKAGGRLDGDVVERTATYVVIETAPGRVRVPMSRVQKIVKNTSVLSEYRAQLQTISRDDVEGWLALARWAHANQLDTQAREAYERAATLDPSRAEAQLAMGHVLVDGHWMTPEDSFRARGLVFFEGSWITPDEMNARVRERVATREARTRETEAAARVAEAEAQARLAEAKARQARNEAGYWPAYGGGVVVPWPYQPCCGQAHAPGLCPFSTRQNIRPLPPPSMPQPPTRPARAPTRAQSAGGARAGTVPRNN